VRSNVTLHAGWFDDTVAPFIAQQQQPVSFIHIDCDLYSSTLTVLRACRERLQVGTVIVFDEYFNYPGWEQHEVRAWKEFVAERGLSYEYIGYAARHYSVAVRITALGAS
jgi:predicted O-methyltransferase YrrM